MAPDESFTFLVTTDNHLGYKDADFIRGEDSFLAFAEALEVGRKHNVDFVLLGGDLFHTSRPSTNVEHKCIQIIRQHINSGSSRSGPTFRRIAGKFCHFEKVIHPNFEDPTLNISCPIMTIHGNHDDLTGPNNQSVCAKLATSGLINYFGLPNKTKKFISIEPIIFEKGPIKIALYGMGYTPDHKLKASMDKGDVHFESPPKDTFNILVVHQNRVALVEGRYIPDKMYPKFFHLIIRGHEHDAQEPSKIPESKVNGIVYQPGSTVATSISTGESGNRRIGIIKVSIANPNGSPASRFKTQYDPFILKSSRRMLFRDIPQKEIFKYIKSACGASKLTPADFKSYSKAFVEQCLTQLIKDNQSRGLPERPFELPLLRARLEYVSKSERFDEFEVSELFYPLKVANRDIVMFKKQKLSESADGQVENVTFNDEAGDEEDNEEFDFIDLSSEKRDTIESALEDYFNNKPSDERLKVLSVSEYIDAIRGSHEDGNVISKVVKTKKKEVLYMYRAELSNESVAESKFHDLDAVESWLLAAFSNNVPKMGGDEDMDVVTID